MNGAHDWYKIWGIGSLSSYSLGNRQTRPQSLFIVCNIGRVMRLKSWEVFSENKKTYLRHIQRAEALHTRDYTMIVG